MRMILVAAGLLCLGWAEPAFACSCVPSNMPTVESYRHWVDGFDGVIFRGTVLKSERVKGGETRVTFRAERYWKGVPTSEVVLYIENSSCAVIFEIGENCVVAAARYNGRLTFSQCLLMLMNQNPKAFREALGEGSPPPAR